MKPDMQSEQHTALFSNNTQAKILHERERERSQRHSLLGIRMERDLSIFLDREYRVQSKRMLKEKYIERIIKLP